MVGFSAACVRGRVRSSRARTQGDAFGGAKGEPEDAGPAQISRVIRVRGVVGSIILAGPAGLHGGRCYWTGRADRDAGGVSAVTLAASQTLWSGTPPPAARWRTPRKLEGGAPWWRLKVFANCAGCL